MKWLACDYCNSPSACIGFQSTIGCNHHICKCCIDALAEKFKEEPKDAKAPSSR